jgi:hypothetical protein
MNTRNDIHPNYTPAKFAAWVEAKCKFNVEYYAWDNQVYDEEFADLDAAIAFYNTLTTVAAVAKAYNIDIRYDTIRQLAVSAHDPKCANIKDMLLVKSIDKQVIKQ